MSWSHAVNLSAPGDDRVTRWPAWERPDGLLVDLRLFGPGGKAEGYYPQRLRRLGVQETFVLAAANSNPQGYVLLPR